MKLVPTGIAALEIGVDTRTLQRWAASGVVIPALVTAGGHLRWNVARLHEQLAAHRERSDTPRGDSHVGW